MHLFKQMKQFIFENKYACSFKSRPVAQSCTCHSASFNHRQYTHVISSIIIQLDAFGWRQEDQIIHTFKSGGQLLLISIFNEKERAGASTGKRPICCKATRTIPCERGSIVIYVTGQHMHGPRAPHTFVGMVLAVLSLRWPTVFKCS